MVVAVVLLAPALGACSEKGEPAAGAPAPAPAKAVASAKLTAPEALRKRFGGLGFDQFECEPMAGGVSTTRCTVGHGFGVRADVLAKQGPAGEWEFVHDPLVSTKAVSQAIARHTADTVSKERGKRVDFTVECGPNPGVAKDRKLTCTIASEERTPKKGQVLVTYDDGGGYRWDIQWEGGTAQ